MNPLDRYADYYTNDRSGMLEYVPRDARRILEIGCGAGRFGATLKASREAEVTGVDISPTAADMARQCLDRVVVADVENDELGLEEGYFDCLACNDVLEHLIDPWRTLHNLRRLLRDGGALVASIPNIRNHKVLRPLIWPGEWRYAEQGILDRTHLRFFTRSSGRELIESAGFAIDRIVGINERKFPFWLRMVNGLGANFLDDMRYVQFVFVARKGPADHRL